MIYETVKSSKEEDNTISVSSVLKIIGVSSSGYYDHFNKEPSKTQKRKIEVAEKIKEIHDESFNIYGSPKITEVLRKEGVIVSQKYVWSIMHENGWRAKYIKPFTITTHSEDFSEKLRNLLNRHFNPTKPDAAWCTDITYIWTIEDGFVYLTSIMDLFSRKIVAWVLTKTMEAEEVLKCIDIAKQRRNRTAPLVIQSDRGVQFTSELYKKKSEILLRAIHGKGLHGITPVSSHSTH